MFEELKATVEAPSPRERRENAWISDATWEFVDRRAEMRKAGILCQREARRLQRKIRASLKADRQERARRAGEAANAELATGNIREAFRHLKGWYREAGEISPRPCLQTMEQQTAERVELYGRVPPPGDPIPINVDAFDVNDGVPPDEEIRGVARDLRNGRAGGASYMRAEDVKSWLRGIEAEEAGEEPKGAGDRWRALVKLVQAIWERGEIPRQLLWVIVVLLPKGGGDYRGIGLLEPIWKLNEAIMDRRLNVIEFHDCLHGYLPKRGTGTGTMEAKLAIQLAHLEQHPLYGIFVDLKKAFDAVDVFPSQVI